MTSHRERQHAPIYSIGLPVWMNAALRHGGVSIVDLQSVPLASGSLRDVEFAALYDSRIPANREAASMASDVGATAIDVANIISAWESNGEFDHNGSERREALVDGIQFHIEQSGYYWLRLGEFPFPYQSSGLSKPATALISHSTSATSFPRPTLERETNDLCWYTNPDELEIWSRFRDAVSYRCRSRDSQLKIEAEFSRGGFPPTLEIWRGAHVARLPLKPGASRIAAGTLVFQSAKPGLSNRVAVKETVEFDSMTTA